MNKSYKNYICLRKTEERKLIVFERKILRKTFRPMMEEKKGRGVEAREE